MQTKYDSKRTLSPIATASTDVTVAVVFEDGNAVDPLNKDDVSLS